MRQHSWKMLTFYTALAMTALTPALVSAQDRPDDRRPDEHQVMKADVHPNEHKSDDHRNDDQLQRYRHDHPHSSARCHDGVFTTTKDRNRACTKHGGIDVWLSL
jgi:beta-xylosidase